VSLRVGPFFVGLTGLLAFVAAALLALGTWAWLRAARAYVLEQGRIVADGAPAALAQDARIREAYVGQR
jgi:hypothetical protein